MFKLNLLSCHSEWWLKGTMNSHYLFSTRDLTYYELTHMSFSCVNILHDGDDVKFVSNVVDAASEFDFAVRNMLACTIDKFKITMAMMMVVEFRGAIKLLCFESMADNSLKNEEDETKQITSAVPLTNIPWRV